ncbi:GTPase [Dermacoccaceae bacterium W4C1]
MTPPAARFGRAALSGPGRAAIGTGAAGALSALSGLPQHASGLMRRRFPSVAVTGMTGVGKSRLADRLAKRTNSITDDEAGSATLERRTSRSARMHGFRFRVVPGDNAATRLGALDEVFHDDPVDGVLHVVAYGHATPRRAAGVTGQAATDREAALAAELEDWAITAHRIASMAIRREKPIWLVIAVNKTDLFPEEIEQAVAYYSPGGNSPFSTKIDELRALAGGARLSIDVLPVSAGAQADADEPSKALVSALEKRMGRLSGHL